MRARPRHVPLLLLPLLTLLAVPSASPVGAAEVPLYPYLDCWDPVGATEVRLHLGVTSLLTTETTPTLNVFTVGDDAVAAPATFEPGDDPRAFSLTVPADAPPVTWALGQSDYVLFFEVGALGADERCANVPGVPGPQGPAGADGADGEDGADGADGVSGHTVVTGDPVELPAGALRLARADCLEGTVALSGGWRAFPVRTNGPVVWASQPDADGWFVRLRSTGAQPVTVEVTATCAVVA